MGPLAPDASACMTARVCETLELVLGFTPNNAYVTCLTTDLWGWNGTNF